MHTNRRFVALAGAVVIATAAGCADDPDPLFEPTGTGAIAGRLFFDANGDELFTPVLGDTAFGAGITVQIRERGTDEVLATTQTDAQGTFGVTGLPPGTHDVFVPEQPVLSGFLVCANPEPATVYIDEQAFVTMGIRRGCVIPISRAEQRDTGSTVTIAGVVTAEPGVYRSNNFYIQDRTGGIQVFGFSVPAGAATPQRGDSIEVTGRLVYFRSELELVSATVTPLKPSVPVPDPEVVPVSAIAGLNPANPDDAAAELFGQLIQLQNVRVGAFPATCSSSGCNAIVFSATDTIEIRLDQAVSTRLPPSSFDQAKCYTITGLLGSFDGTEQIKPRGPEDVTEVVCQ